MHNLDSFNKKLQRDFPRYRVRFSPFRESYLIEVKMGPGYWNVDTSGFDEDTKIQVREGYIEWGEITLGDRMKCCNCSNTLKVPVREFREVICNWCEQTQPARAYFELNDDLIMYFNKLRNRNVSAKQHRSHNEGLVDEKHEKMVTNAAYHAHDNRRFIYGNPSNVGPKINWHSIDVNT